MTGSRYIVSMADGDVGESIDMTVSVRSMEQILGYTFIDKTLLVKALTHPSYSGTESYQRLEFVGDSALELMITNFAYLAFPDLEPGDLSVIRSANISTEKLARVAVRHGFYKYIRHKVPNLDEKIKEFCEIVQLEDETVVHGGEKKAPKVLADIVESVIAAVYVDLSFNLHTLWKVIRELLEPIITLDMLQQQPQPVSMLFHRCHKDGKQVDIKQWRNEDKNVASVFVDGKFIVSASSDQKENAKLQAAKAALNKIPYHNGNINNPEDVDGNCGIEAAKGKLHDLCSRKKWPKPCYSIDKEVGPAHHKKFVCSVKCEISSKLFVVEGEEKSRIKDAENSAASVMLRGLKAHNYI